MTFHSKLNFLLNNSTGLQSFHKLKEILLAKIKLSRNLTYYLHNHFQFIFIFPSFSISPLKQGLKNFLPTSTSIRSLLQSLALQ